MLRKASAADLEAIASHREAEFDAKTQCRRLAADLKLDLKVVEARQAFDGPKLTITFFAEERTDVRELQNKLGDRLGRRVELKQVSARDESRIVGGYGPCGRSLCCATFAGDQEPVSIRMAKDQNLPLNPTKICGCCGRLMCCLKYEHQVYVSFRKRAPKRGAIVRTPDGEGKVTDLLAPVDSVTVDLGEGRSATFKLDELGSPAASGRNDTWLRLTWYSTYRPCRATTARWPSRTPSAPSTASARWTSTSPRRPSPSTSTPTPSASSPSRSRSPDEGYEVAGRHVFGA